MASYRLTAFRREKSHRDLLWPIHCDRSGGDCPVPSKNEHFNSSDDDCDHCCGHKKKKNRRWRQGSESCDCACECDCCNDHDCPPHDQSGCCREAEKKGDPTRLYPANCSACRPGILYRVQQKGGPCCSCVARYSTRINALCSISNQFACVSRDVPCVRKLVPCALATAASPCPCAQTSCLPDPLPCGAGCLTR